MGGELTHHRSYLTENRRYIIGRSLAAAAAGALPVPVLEEWLSSRVQRGTIRRIAESRSVDLDDAAIRAIADGPQKPPEWAEIAGGSLAFRLAARSLRRLVLVYLAARRAQAATRSFLIATLFDHYCARLHVGMGLDGPRAHELRAAMDRAIARTPGKLGRRLFRRSVLGAARASVRGPIRIADAVTGGMIRRLLDRNDEAEAAQIVDESIDRQLRSKKSFLSRSVAAVELELVTDANPYLEQLLATFDRQWREHERTTTAPA